uniref:Nucleolar complex protein 3 n=1 Tax=Anthurium amnicola TaxID=1678845 RepID=A0A1D1YM11_9ARAE
MRKKKQVIRPPDLPPETREEDVEVSDEDLEFVRQNRDYAGFLTRLDSKSLDRHVVRVADKKEDDLEKLYEKRNRKLSLQKAMDEKRLEIDPVDALPVKTLDGQLYYRTATESKSMDILDEEEAATMNNDDSKGKVVVRLTKAERRQKLKKIKKEAKRQAEEKKVEVGTQNPHAAVLAKVEEDLSIEEVFVQKKNKLAEIGMSLLEDPESNIKTLKDLLQFCDDDDQKVVKLSLLSLLAVFKDIIPGYRIRPLTEKELEVKVSKAVRKMRFYESTLLHEYKQYLLTLLALEKKPSFKLVAVRCMCNLLDAVTHFNFYEKLLSGVVKNISSSDDIIRKLCCESVKSLFGNEGKHGGKAILEAVELISNLVKIHDCQLHPDCVEVFCSLVFDEDVGKSESKEGENTKLKKKRRRQTDEKPNQITGNEKKMSKQELMAKMREEVKADFKSGSLAPDDEERRNIQSQTLAAVFETYFRVLKRTMDPDVSRSKGNNALFGGSVAHPLLAPCLKGLGKFSHLIDLDFMGDIMGCLKKLSGLGGSQDAPPENCLSVSERLQCCIVAFKVMRNNLDALNIDLQDFYGHLYNLLLEYRPDRDQGDVLAEALKTMLCQGKQHDMQRAAAFIKRVATFSLCVGPAEAMTALVTVQHLLLKNTKCRNLLENDVGGGSLSGLVVKYHPDASDPNLSGALASVLWELSLLGKHYHPTISSTASSISRMSTSHNQCHLSTTSPQQAFLDLSIEQEPFMPTGKPASLSRKRKREISAKFSSLTSKQIQSRDWPVDENEVRSKMEEHFTLLREITENERLRVELNHTLSCIGLYKEYKKQMGRNEGLEDGLVAPLRQCSTLKKERNEGLDNRKKRKSTNDS